ncbi:hypothetical protein ACFOKF_22430 [Sphingobium rhizovicinum]|uniref:Restriction endonuclease type IV Mrr domain-containing protein n=1 Tax=Sphingobium rhizovicinum TaxID=432308 RepID=A0ABV7NKN8_9SPHN
MAFDAATLSYVEDALSEGFKFHSNLDAFLLRSGLKSAVLAAARGAAEDRSIASGKYAKAPKRFVVQAVMAELAEQGDAGDHVLAAIITSLTQLTTSDASDAAKSAIEALRGKIRTDRELKAEMREEREKAAREADAAEHRVRAEARTRRTETRDALRDRFTGLMSEGNAQARGYLFETFLSDLFDFEGLDARRSFKLTGEQIDGSFLWRARTHLVEAKWTKNPAAGSEFGAFDYKIRGKTADTRGLFVSINGYSPEAIAGMNGKGELKFVCIDGVHLMRALSSDEGLTPLMEKIWRHADETGEAYLPASRF